MEVKQHEEANCMSSQKAASLVASWKTTQIGYLFSIAIVLFFIGFVVPKIPEIENILIPPLTENVLFETIPTITTAVFLVVGVFYIIANVRLVTRQILHIQGSAPYVVSDGTYLSHRVRSRRNKYTSATHRLIVRFKDNHCKRHKASSPMFNQGYFQEMNIGDHIIVVSVTGFLGMRKYSVYIPQYFNESKTTK